MQATFISIFFRLRIKDRFCLKSIRSVVHLIFCLALTVVSSSVVNGALPPLSASTLQNYAQVIVVGTVESIEQKRSIREPGSIDMIYTVRINITAVEKSTFPIESKKIVAQGWHAKERSNGKVGPAGVYGLPELKEGHTVRLFLLGKVEPFGILEPNGIEVLH